MPAAFVARPGGNDADLGVSPASASRRARAPIDILTGGVDAAVLRSICGSGCRKAIFAFSVNLVALLGAAISSREKYGVMLLYLILVMGIQGMVMTRDLFNLFVFLEIVSIATYGLLSLQRYAGGAVGDLQISHGDGAGLDASS